VQAAVPPLVRCVKERLGAPDQDQEVKECAISCAAAVAAVLGPELKKELPGLLQVCAFLHPVKTPCVHMSAMLVYMRSSRDLACTGCSAQDLLGRLQHESTRLAAVKAFTRIAQSAAPTPVDLSCVLEPLLAELTPYLRKANRQLRHASLAAIEVLPCCAGCAVSCPWSCCCLS
jgi:cullin-associated NEDD8-dissociated protein 1